MGLLLSIWWPVSYLLAMATVYVAIWLFVRRMPVRQDLGWRVAVFAALHAAIAAVLLLGLGGATQAPIPDNPYTSAITLITLGLFYVSLPLLVLFLYECPAWDAVFCAAAGYTVQNLASSSIELVRALLGMPPRTVGTPTETLFSLVGYLLVYLLCNRLFIDRASRVGLGHGSRRYAVPLLAVMVVVVLFDTQVKAVALSGNLADTALTLRVAHVATCAFTLYAEYQIVYVGRLSAQIAAERSVREGEERLWEVSRQNVAAINARVHDMRHQVARTLAESPAGVDRETLSRVTHEIRVYDTNVRTGNAVLDTILSERGLVYGRDGMQLAVIADGGAVAGVDDADLFAIMGTLMDAAAAAVVLMADSERRRMSVQVREVAGMAAIHVGCPAVEGLEAPRLNDTRAIVSRLGGTLSSDIADGELSLDVLLPLSLA